MIECSRLSTDFLIHISIVLTINQLGAMSRLIDLLGRYLTLNFFIIISSILERSHFLLLLRGTLTQIDMSVSFVQEIVYGKANK